MLKIRHFLITLHHFPIVYVLEVVYVYRTCVTEVLCTSMPLHDSHVRDTASAVRNRPWRDYLFMSQKLTNASN